MMNRQRITEDPKSVGPTILWAILAGIGLGIGFLIVNKIDKKLEKKSG